MKQNTPCYLFGMYEPDTNSVIVNANNDTYTGTPLTISCEKCNSADIDIQAYICLVHLQLLQQFLFPTFV